MNSNGQCTPNPNRFFVGVRLLSDMAYVNSVGFDLIFSVTVRCACACEFHAGRVADSRFFLSFHLTITLRLKCAQILHTYWDALLPR